MKAIRNKKQNTFYFRLVFFGYFVIFSNYFCISFLSLTVDLSYISLADETLYVLGPTRDASNLCQS